MVVRNFAFLLVLALASATLSPAATEKKPLACATCHPNQANPQPATDMAQALANPLENPALKNFPTLALQRGNYRYTVTSSALQSTYSVSDGKDTITVPILWPFGRETQTWMLEYQGKMYESLVSFYPRANGLDVTLGDSVIQPSSLLEAFGRPLDHTEVTSCFGCHSTGSQVNRTLQLEHLTRGLTCSRCHQATDVHLQAVGHGQLAAVPPKLGKQSAEEISSFCGQCHRTWQTVVRNHWLGEVNVRFQPYRLANSRCFDGVDQRISCLGCHNPHEELVRDDRKYDSKCLACHSASAVPSFGQIALNSKPGAEVKMKMCPVAEENCVSCHMPKVPLPGAHRTFTDHYIRVTKPGAPYLDRIDVNSSQAATAPVPNPLRAGKSSSRPGS